VEKELVPADAGARERPWAAWSQLLLRNKMRLLMLGGAIGTYARLALWDHGRQPYPDEFDPTIGRNAFSFGIWF
jgi:hypothetical protein